MTVEQIIGKVFSIDPSAINDASARDSINGWDSMGHLSLILELEAAFEVSIPISDAFEMDSVSHIKQKLRSYGVHC